MANAIYDDGSDAPTDIRFFFTSDEVMRETEKNFFNCFVHMEVEMGKVFNPLTKYIALTDIAQRQGSQEPEFCKTLYNERVECLKLISGHVKNMFKVFRDYINYQKVSKDV